MLYTILIFRDFIFKENALFTYFIVLFLYKTVKTAESILNSNDIVYLFFIFRLFVFVLPKCVFLCSVLFFAQSITVVKSIIFGVVVCQQYHVCPRNTPHFIPPGVGAYSSCPYPDINKNVYFLN